MENLLSQTGWEVPGFADGSERVARFDSPADVTVAPDGNRYVADTKNHSIRQVCEGGGGWRGVVWCGVVSLCGVV
jgi:hypothetical protein